MVLLPLDLTAMTDQNRPIHSPEPFSLLITSTEWTNNFLLPSQSCRSCRLSFLCIGFLQTAHFGAMHVRMQLQAMQCRSICGTAVLCRENVGHRPYQCFVHHFVCALSLGLQLFAAYRRFVYFIPVALAPLFCCHLDQ